MKTRKVNLVQRIGNKPIRVAWLSNDPVLPTGYAKVTREVLSRLAKDPRFEVVALAEGYVGAPKQVLNFTALGVPMDNKAAYYVENHLKMFKPDVVIILEDTFTMFNLGISNINFLPYRLIFYTPMDGEGIPTTGHPILKKSNKIISMSDFTKQVLGKEGFQSEVIWHGVDLFQFKPISHEKKMALRRKYNLPEDKYIFFNFGRNSLRKFNNRLLDILCATFQRVPNSVALLNIMHYNTKELDLTDYIQRYLVPRYGKEITSRLLFNEKMQVSDQMPGITDGEIAEMLALSDMAISASTGEGSGLIMPESMASGIPIVHTDYSTTYEWLLDTSKGIGQRGIGVPVKDKVVSSFNVEHGHVDEDKFVDAIVDYVNNKKLQEEYIKNGRRFVERYANWDLITEQWKQQIFDTVY